MTIKNMESLTTSELISKLEGLEERRKALINKMAECDLPVTSESFIMLVTEKNKTLRDMERIHKHLSTHLNKLNNY